VRGFSSEELEALRGSDDPEVKKLFSELIELLEDNPLQAFEPNYSQQHDFLSSRKTVKGFFGGNRSGKTTTGIVDDIIQAVPREFLPEHLLPYKFWDPPFLCRIVSPDFTSTMEGAIFETIRKWVPRSALKGGSWDAAYDKQRRMLRFVEGSWFQFLTAEQDVDKHSGAALDRVHFDEEPPGEKGLQLYRENMMRLIDRAGQILITMTPLFGMSWVYDEIWQKRGEDHIFVTTADMDSNTTLDSDAKRLMLSGLSQEEIQARKEGRFVHFAGHIYSEFGERHLVDPPSPEHVRQLDTMVSIDPGVRRMAAVWGGFDKDNSCVLYDELYAEGMTVEQAVEAINAKNAEWGITPMAYIIDPSARNRTLTNAEQVTSEFARYGIYCVPGQNAVEPGIFQTKRRLQAEPAALYVSRACEWFRWEIQRYRYDPKNTSVPLKEHDHLMDASRYLLMARAWGAPPKPANNMTRSRFQYGIAPEPEYDLPEQTEAPMGVWS
jgi:phage terminase large subunit-like protein